MRSAEANDAGAITKSDGKAAASCRTPTNANQIAAADRARWCAACNVPIKKKRQPRLPLFATGHTLTWRHYTTPRELSWSYYFGELSSYHFARMRYFRTEVPSLATGTMNCAANAAVFVYLYEE